MSLASHNICTYRQTLKNRLARTTFTTAQAAARAGIHRDTLLRWLREQRVPEPQRDGNGWRRFTEEQLKSIVRFAKGRTSIAESSASYTESKSMVHLQNLDWDFVGARGGYLTHSLHPYPAKFIPQIPNTLIQELSSVGETVLDMFCGSGTTLVEALVLKRNAVGIDANPLACLISQAKTTAITSEDKLELESLALKAREYAASVSLAVPNLFSDAPFRSQAPRPNHDSVDFWFESFVVEELAEIRAWCFSLTSAPARTLALTAFSAIIVAVSKQDSDTRYVRRDKGLQPGTVFSRFERALSKSVQAAWEFSDIVEERFTCTVFQENILADPGTGTVDLVVCSPPYLNAYSYHLYHMTRMVWLEMDQPTFKEVEIGSHRKYSRKGKNGANEKTFRSECKIIFSWLRRTLRSDRYACFVVGDSTLNGKRINVADLMAYEGREEGFTECARIDRTLQATRKSFNPKIGKIKTEQILIVKNDN